MKKTLCCFFFLVSIYSTLIAVLMQKFYLSGDTHISAEECSKSRHALSVSIKPRLYSAADTDMDSRRSDS